MNEVSSPLPAPPRALPPPATAAPLRVASPHSYALGQDSDVGGEVYERMLLERLPQHGIELVLGLPRPASQAQRAPGVQVDRLRHPLGMHWLRAPVVFSPWVARLLLAHRVALLRGHSVRHTGPSLLLTRSALRSAVPVVLHHHHFTPRWRGLEAAILRRADAVVTVSEHSRAQLIGEGIAAGRIQVALPGVSRPPRAPAVAGVWPTEGPRLLHVGRLEARKRAWVAIDALARLRAEGLDASLVLAGDGPQRSELIARTRALGLAEAVRFLGRVPEELKWQLYDSAQLLLFASTLEGFGLVVAEAQSRGLPVIAAAGTATSEALLPGRSGLLAAPAAEAFAEAARQLTQEPARSEFAARAERFARRFDWDACAATVAGIYRTLAGPASA
jgi:glycosyltransferase involved in cell wall biosynthesis